MSKIIQVSFIIGIITAGISYAILSDPELPTQGLFKATLVEFSIHAEPLERRFKKASKMQTSRKKFTVTYLNDDNPLAKVGVIDKFVVNMQVSEQRVTLVFSNKQGPLAGQSIILEPQVLGEQATGKVVTWKCINGSVLARVRTKNCRLGYGHSRIEMSQL